MRCKGGVHITGLQVRYARLERGDRDMYDFRARCGASWHGWLGLKLPESVGKMSDHVQTEAAVCPIDTAMTGVRVMRGRNERRDQDYYNFKLRCNETWAAQPMGLAFDGKREEKVATCPNGRSVGGLRVHRGFQDWGDMDTYEFQLFCGGKGPRRDAGKGAGRGGAAGNRGGAAGGNRAGRPAGGGGRAGRVGTYAAGASNAAASTFGARSAAAEAAAAEVAAEAAAAAKAAKAALGAQRREQRNAARRGRDEL